MNTKLTLTIDKGIIKKAKKYAMAEKRSLSGIVENYLKMITREPTDKGTEPGPIVKSLRGSFKADEKLDYKQALTRGLTEKYLKDEEGSN